MTCVDPFSTADPHTPVDEYTKGLFLNNIAISPQSEQINLIQSTSADFYPGCTDTYDFIYIDGSHVLGDVTVDFINCLNLVKVGGVVWIDDYGADHLGLNHHIDQLLNDNSSQIHVFYKSYQAAFQRLV
jgi:predicted O-methyltransferase YrrM